MEHSLDNCIALLRTYSQRGYGKRLPGPCDDTFSSLAVMYLGTDAVGREAIRKSIPDECRLVILGFSDRFATLAARARSEEQLRKAYAAHSIEGFRYDERENILRLALLTHVAKKLGLNPNELLDWTASLSSTETQQQLAAFKDRPDEINTLETMGIQELDTADGVLYDYVL